MQKKKGISLIVLVITIIVMIVLAGAIILSLNNAGIIDKANQAVRDTDEATVKELAQMAWAEAYAEYGPNQTKLKEGVKSALLKNNLDPEDYAIIESTSGVKIQKGWMQNGLSVIKGSQKLEIGDLVSYDAKVDTYTSTWKVLGAEDGKLLIVSSDSIVAEKYQLGDYGKTGNIELAKNDYINGALKLNTECEMFGKGKGALGARSITVEDVNKVSGYDSMKDTAYIGQINQYGNKVTYTWNGFAAPSYTTTNNLVGTLDEEDHANSFIYYNKDKFLTSTNTETAAEKSIEIVTLQNNYYNYFVTTLTNHSANDEAEIVGIPSNSKAYKMLFRNGADTMSVACWLASPGICQLSDKVNFGLHSMGGNGSIKMTPFVISNGSTSGSSLYIRAVVYLDSDIQFSGSSEEGWKF